MRNDAMFDDRNSFNTFTLALKEAIRVQGEKGKIDCTLRNGTKFYVTFKTADHPTCSDSFHTPDWAFCWNLDGSSLTARQFDIVGF